MSGIWKTNGYTFNDEAMEVRHQMEANRMRTPSTSYGRCHTFVIAQGVILQHSGTHVDGTVWVEST